MADVVERALRRGLKEKLPQMTKITVLLQLLAISQQAKVSLRSFFFYSVGTVQNKLFGSSFNVQARGNSS